MEIKEKYIRFGFRLRKYLGLVEGQYSIANKIEVLENIRDYVLVLCRYKDMEYLLYCDSDVKAAICMDTGKIIDREIELQDMLKNREDYSSCALRQ